MPTEKNSAKAIAYTVQEAADSIGISRDAIYKRLRSGKLKGIKFGKRTLIYRTELERFLDEESTPYDPDSSEFNPLVNQAGSA